MFKKLQGVDLVPEYVHSKAKLYRLDADKLSNKYYIVTSASTRHLLNTPEVVGFENYDRMCNPTKTTLDFFNKKGLITSANILTILRGGLNYPLEECCYRAGIPVNDMSFLSCERVFDGELITGLDIKYKKLSIIDGGTLIIGDIIATGDPIDAKVSSRLIMNIFFKNSPLHDGAMIIGNDRIIAARCTLPISERPGLPARYGMRHKAAVGISERSDADVIVVSEQTGGISFVSAGEVTPVDSSSTLKLLIRGKQKEEEESKK